ncbi:DUF2934 domain-containing protein [Rhizobium favelukesii]|nr:DUF2934 domain-containing protein [Rhizobium favelukesii]
MDGDRYNWISRQAHQIWQQEGCPSGAIASTGCRQCPSSKG